MLSIASVTQKVQLLAPDKDQIIEMQARQIKSLLAENTRLNQRINDMHSEHTYTKRLYEVKGITGNEKLALHTMKEQILTLRVNPFEETQISLQNIAKKTGLSEPTIGRAAQTLKDMGLINKRNDTPVIGNDGKPHTHAFISLTEKAIDLEGIERPLAKQQGGARVCKCGSQKVKSYPIHICEDCGNVEFSEGARNALGSVQNMHIDEPLEAPVTHLNDKKQDAFEQESTIASEPVASVQASTNDEKHLAFESIVLAVEALLVSYKVKYNSHMTCSCGCQLWRTTINDFLCARCEPSPVWPDKYNEILHRLYPSAKKK